MSMKKIVLAALIGACAGWDCSAQTAPSEEISTDASAEAVSPPVPAKKPRRKRARHAAAQAPVPVAQEPLPPEDPAPASAKKALLPGGFSRTQVQSEEKTPAKAPMKKKRRAPRRPAGDIVISSPEPLPDPAPSPEAVTALPGVQEGSVPAEEAAVPEQPKEELPAREPEFRENGEASRMKGYLEARLDELKRVYSEQEAFGRRNSEEWQAFWSKMNKERRLFELRMARQRLNLLESLSSLEPGAHKQTLADFERMQGNQLKSFEEAQKGAYLDFFRGTEKSVHEFGVEQERQRAAFLKEMSASWERQKKGDWDPGPARGDDSSSSR
ncbi:MAG: hypothetical protein WCU88_03775 [Elusimicrobiota bacterium]|jgi:hypothetical protein